MNEDLPPPPLTLLEYAPSPKKPAHDQVFTGLLIALAFLLVLVLGQFTIMRVSGRFVIGDRVFPFLMPANVLYFTSIIAALILRWCAPGIRRAATIAVSIILLFLFPLGTIVGIYGLWKVDRAPRP
jgi:hypothetical protein